MEGQKTFALVAGVVAIIMMVALAVVMSTKPAGPYARRSLQRAAMQRQTEMKPSNNTVRAVVKTPVANDVKQSVTVK